MILTVSKFRKYVEDDINGLVDELSCIGRVVSDEEKKAWRESYKCVSRMFALAMGRNPRIGEVRVSTTNVVPEYKLPASSSWCDLVLLGKGHGQNQVLIIELKNWLRNDSDFPGEGEGLIGHKGQQVLHPADQVRGYTEYCRHFHSTVMETGANVDGCVFFTQPVDLGPYEAAPNKALCSEYPLFNLQSDGSLTDYFLDRIEEGDERFAHSFVNGFYVQDRNILRQVAGSLRAAGDARPFVLLEEQRRGFNLAMSTLERSVGTGGKEVIIIEGPPGSGKSAVAINLWIEASLRYAGREGCGNIVYVTTSGSQKDNWKDIFNTHGGNRVAGAFILTSNNFNPGMTGKSMKEEYLPVFRARDRKYVSRKSPDSLRYEHYEDYTNYMVENGLAKNYMDNHHFLSVVDEAHALINPSAEGFSSNNAAGWCFQMGPQAYHIMRESRVSVFLTDGRQSFRDNETTSVGDLEGLAGRLGAHVTKLSLEDIQFRCAGSVEYVNWVDRLLTEHPLANHAEWGDKFHVEIVDWPSDVDAYLRDRMENGGGSARLLSTYTRKWVSKDSLDESHGRAAMHDFVLKDKDGREYRKYWNSTNKCFVQASGGAMRNDPLSEVGCPYTVRGFDYDHVGVLWLGDLVWRDGHWMVDFDKAQETANDSTRKRAREEQARLRGLRGSKAKRPGLARACQEGAPQTMALFETMAQAYRIIMTRAIRSACLYVEDMETREHIRKMLEAGS